MARKKSKTSPPPTKHQTPNTHTPTPDPSPTEYRTPNTKHLPPCSNPDQPDAIEEYSIMKTEITKRIKAIGLNLKYPVTGDRNYILEDDGTLRMRYADVDRATNTWRKREWAYFQADCKAGLWAKLEALGK